MGMELVYEVEKLLLMGKPLDLIVDGLKAGNPKADPPRPPQTEKAIKAAHDEVLRRWTEDAGTKDVDLARQLRTLRHLYDKSYKLNDFKTCACLARDMDKLQAKIQAARVVEGAGKVRNRGEALNAKQSAFVREYVIDHNGTQAAIRAGYSKRSAGSIAGDLLQKPEIRAAISLAEAEAMERADVTVDWVMDGLKREALHAPNAAARIRARELLGKQIGMFLQRVEVTGKDGAPLQAQAVDELDLSALSLEELATLKTLRQKATRGQA